MGSCPFASRGLELLFIIVAIINYHFPTAFIAGGVDRRNIIVLGLQSGERGSGRVNNRIRA